MLEQTDCAFYCHLCYFPCVREAPTLTFALGSLPSLECFLTRNAQESLFLFQIFVQKNVFMVSASLTSPLKTPPPWPTPWLSLFQVTALFSIVLINDKLYLTQWLADIQEYVSYVKARVVLSSFVFLHLQCQGQGPTYGRHLMNVQWMNEWNLNSFKTHLNFLLI